MSEITLTKGQLNAVAKFNLFVNSQDRYMVLSGFAGTGKTTILNYLLEEFSGKVALTTPTHKSLKVAREKTNSDNYSDDRTIHSLLNLKLKKVRGKEILTHDSDQPSKLDNVDLIVVDETSQVGKELFEHLDKQLTESDRLIRVLFIGDSFQWPPIGESISCTFEVPNFKAELTEVVRQALDNPIIAFTVQIRKAISAVNEDLINFKTSFNDGKGIKVYPKTKGFREAIFSKVDEANDVADEFRVISWRNAVVNKFNDVIRKHIYNGTPKEDFVVGELVIVNDTIDLGSGEFLNRDSEGVIKSVTKTRVSKFDFITREPLDAYELFIYVPFADRYFTCTALSSVSTGVFNKTLKHLASAKNWQTFWTMKETFKDIRHIHSITCHKSQGSTYTEAFVIKKRR